VMDMVLLLRFSLCCIWVLFIHLGGFVAPPVSTLHPSAFHPSRWCVLCFILMLFISPCGGFNVRCVQVVGSTFHPSSKWWVLHFIRRPSGGFYISSVVQGVGSTFHPSSKRWVLHFIRRPRGGFYISSVVQGVGSTFHPSSKWWVLHFMRPSGGFYISSVQVVGSTFHPSRWQV